MKPTIKFSIAITAILPAAMFAQDTLYSKWDEKILCKVTEIGTAQIKYKKWNNISGPDFEIRKRDVQTIHFSNGTKFDVFPNTGYEYEPVRKRKKTQRQPAKGRKEEEQVDQTKVYDNDKAIKFNILSLALSHLDFGYEQVFKPGFNLEGNVGLIGIGATSDAHKSNGYFLKGGIKFLLGKELFKKGTHYGNPFNGQYVKLELAYTSFTMRDVDFEYTDSGTAGVTMTNIYNNQYYYSAPLSGKTNIHTEAFALNIIYGHQYVIKDRFTFEWFAGFGIGHQGKTFSDPHANMTTVNSDSNYHAFLSADVTGPMSTNGGTGNFSSPTIISATGGLTLGFLFN